MSKEYVLGAPGAVPKLEDVVRVVKGPLCCHMQMPTQDHSALGEATNHVEFFITSFCYE